MAPLNRHERGTCMPSRQIADQPLSPELDAIATAAAADRLRAQCGNNSATVAEHAERVADAASAAIRAGAALSAIADAPVRRRRTRPHRPARRHPSPRRARRQTQARGPHRLRPGDRARRATRALPPRHRHRRPGHPRHHPRPPSPRRDERRDRPGLPRATAGNPTVSVCRRPPVGTSALSSPERQ